jgi:hypothetical protein
MGKKHRAMRLLGLVALVLAVSGVAAPYASAVCDINIGSQFSKSNPLINVTANTSVTPAGVTVGGLGWSWNGVKTNLGGGYYRTQ